MVVPKSSSSSDDDDESGRSTSGPLPLVLPALLIFEVRREAVAPFVVAGAAFPLLAGPGGLKGTLRLNPLADEADVLRDGGMMYFVRYVPSTFLLCDNFARSKNKS